jgi:hypothetical protein
MAHHLSDVYGALRLPNLGLPMLVSHVCRHVHRMGIEGDLRGVEDSGFDKCIEYLNAQPETLDCIMRKSIRHRMGVVCSALRLPGALREVDLTVLMPLDMDASKRMMQPFVIRMCSIIQRDCMVSLRALHLQLVPLDADEEWAQWRVDGPGPHAAHQHQPHLRRVVIEQRIFV